MEENLPKQPKKGMYIIISIITAIIVGAGVYFWITNQKKEEMPISNSVRNETFRADNYEQLMERAEQELVNDNDIYYLTYSMMYYIVKDGMTAAFSDNGTEADMYINIYGKKVSQLIEEGKQLMKENNMTIEDYKKELDNMSNVMV